MRQKRPVMIGMCRSVLFSTSMDNVEQAPSVHFSMWAFTKKDLPALGKPQLTKGKEKGRESNSLAVHLFSYVR